jgi:hypothetical protein
VRMDLPVLLDFPMPHLLVRAKPSWPRSSMRSCNSAPRTAG